MKQFAIYIRVSTQRQGISGLGLESQKEICMNYIKENNGELLTTFQDVESGKSRNREGLLSAIDFCKANKCTLVFAKLDRLARDVEFTFKVINTGIDVHFCDMPQLNTLILGVMATVAQYERELISQRTKAALKAKKERGELTGGACRSEFNTHKAVESSAKSRRLKARNNPNNLAFYECYQMFKESHGELNANSDFQPFTDFLNRFGKTTSTGLAFTKLRARAMFYSMKKIFEDD